MDPYQMLFGGGMFDPALGSLLSTNPEAIIPQLASQGVMPPSGMFAPEGPPVTMPNTSAPLPLPPGMEPSTPRPPQAPQPLGGSPRPRPAPFENPLAGASAADADMGYSPGTPPAEPAATPDVTAARRTGAGTPLDIRSPAQRAGEANPQKQQQANDLMKQLQGLKAPPPPTAQTVRTPEAPPRGNALAANPALTQLLLASMAGSIEAAKPLYLQNALGGFKR